MDGDAQRRFCGLCSKHVHDLSAMTEAEAEALVTREQSSGLCVRYRARPDGSIAHRPVLAQTLRAAALGATLIAMPAMASTAPSPGELTALDTLQALIEAAVELVMPGEVMLGRPAVDLSQLQSCPEPGCDPDPEPRERMLMGDPAIKAHPRVGEPTPLPEAPTTKSPPEDPTHAEPMPRQRTGSDAR
jgi:hypothetical protein